MRPGRGLGGRRKSSRSASVTRGSSTAASWTAAPAAPFPSPACSRYSASASSVWHSRGGAGSSNDPGEKKGGACRPFFFRPFSSVPDRGSIAAPDVPIRPQHVRPARPALERTENRLRHRSPHPGALPRHGRAHDPRRSRRPGARSHGALHRRRHPAAGRASAPARRLALVFPSYGGLRDGRSRPVRDRRSDRPRAARRLPHPPCHRPLVALPRITPGAQPHAHPGRRQPAAAAALLGHVPAARGALRDRRGTRSRRRRGAERVLLGRHRRATRPVHVGLLLQRAPEIRAGVVARRNGGVLRAPPRPPRHAVRGLVPPVLPGPGWTDLLRVGARTHRTDPHVRCDRLPLATARPAGDVHHDAHWIHSVPRDRPLPVHQHHLAPRLYAGRRLGLAGAARANARARWSSDLLRRGLRVLPQGMPRPAHDAPPSRDPDPRGPSRRGHPRRDADAQQLGRRGSRRRAARALAGRSASVPPLAALRAARRAHGCPEPGTPRRPGLRGGRAQ